MQLATVCQMLFLTPVEDIICDLPDGGVVSHHEECPICDPNRFSKAWNKDFLKD